MSDWRNEQDTVIFTAPIQSKKDCFGTIDAVESAEWTVKSEDKGGAPGHEGEVYPAMKLTLTITDPDVHCEYENARPRLTVEHQMNLARYPYLDKKTGQVRWLGRTGLYELEEALGFEPIFVNGQGERVEPFISRTGRKLAPKIEGVKRELNPDFLSVYFHSDGTPTLEWSGKKVFFDIEIEENETYGARNRITRFKAPPSMAVV